jgi:hypothetical protein
VYDGGKLTVTALSSITDTGTVVLKKGSTLQTFVVPEDAYYVSDAPENAGTYITPATTFASANIAANFKVYALGNIAPVENLDVKGTLVILGAAAPVGDVTVSTGSVTVANGGSLTIATGKTLNIAANKTVALVGTGSVVLTGATATGGAKLTGAGAVTAQLTSRSGGEGGWQAVNPSSTGNITIASTATAGDSSITGSTATVVLTAGTGATITQAAGASTDGLTITNGTSAALVVSFGTTGTLTLKYGATAAKITLPANGIIGFNTTVATKDVTNADLKTALGDTTNGTAIGSSLAGKALAEGTSTLTQIIGAASNNTITGPTTTADMELKDPIAATGQS